MLSEVSKNDWSDLSGLNSCIKQWGGEFCGEEGTGVANRETEEQEEKMETACPEYV